MSSSTANRDGGEQHERSPDELRRDIESTREEMSETLEALGDKLSPQRQIEHRREQVREQTEEARSAMTARAQDVGQQVRQRVEQARTSATAGAQHAREAVGESDRLTPWLVAGGTGGAALLAVMMAGARRRRRSTATRAPFRASARMAAAVRAPSRPGARSLQDAGLAAWFGDALLGAVGLALMIVSARAVGAPRSPLASGSSPRVPLPLTR